MTEQAVPTATTDVLLHAAGICKSFPGVQALSNVQLTVRRGRLNALLGENGAGKSTLMHILSGVFAADRGQILVNGVARHFRSPHEAQTAGISTIYQELNLIPDMSVAENIFLGREPRNRFGLIDFRQMRSKARTLLAKLSMDIDPQTRVNRLRVGEQQTVEIAKALSTDASVIIMDEPTSAISDHEIESLFLIIRQLKQAGVGVVYITHKFDELPHIADDVTIFRDGKFICERPYREVTHDDLVRLMVGRTVTEMPQTERQLGAEVLRVRNLRLPHPRRMGDFAIRDVSFSVRRGEIVGLFGLMGAGRTELLQTIFGLHPNSSGALFVEGNPAQIRSPEEAIRVGFALAPEDRKAEGLILPMTVAENISLANLRNVAPLGLLDVKRERKVCEMFVDRLRVKAASPGQSVRNLSGGNQQKVVVSKWLAVEPKVLLLDEPTRGIDVNAKREMYALINELARDGLGIVMASSEMPEILALADRILVLAEGRVTAEFARGEATEEDLLKAALPQSRLQKAKSA